MPSKKQSDFGKGLVYNLVLFMSHAENSMARKIGHYAFVMGKSPSEQEKILTDFPDDSHNYGFNKDVKWWFENIVPIYGTPEKALSNEIELWANGASDHLYEIEFPKKWKKTHLANLISELKNKGLRMGHGFMGENHTIEDFEHLIELTRKIALLIDKELGLKPIEAKWK